MVIESLNLRFRSLMQLGESACCHTSEHEFGSTSEPINLVITQILLAEVMPLVPAPRQLGYLS